MNAEVHRLAETRQGKADWRLWGPYLSERQWGTVREDYSPGGTAWDYFPHDHARSRAYRWGEDGLAGISDRQQRLCFAIALWNGQDPILKERIFGVTGSEGNHGEDAKEYYFYLDNTPSHAYMKYLYKYPHGAFPYSDLVAENRRRTREDLEYELLDTGIFDGNRYFDVIVEYAKASPADILIRIRAINRAAYTASLHFLPTLWFRNTWSWVPDSPRPSIKTVASQDGRTAIEATHPKTPPYWLYCESPEALLFTENETNNEKLWGTPNGSPYVKDGFNDYVVDGRLAAVNPAQQGTKAAALFRLELPAGQAVETRLRLSTEGNLENPLGESFDALFDLRLDEAQAFYKSFCPNPLDEDMTNIQRQAFAGLLWGKQFYYFDVNEWLQGDPAGPSPPEARNHGRNHEWWHLNTADILSMPDKWEYPWFAAWDLAFHTLPLAMIDPDFAKAQLLILTREWYMHPNGQIPAYEWAFGDVNPPVHAWAALRVYQIERKMHGREDRKFLERVFQKLLLNFTWWVNRKDTQGNNVFEGGFLGLDNIGAFDRSARLPSGGYLEQADGTSWMAMYCLNMLAIALELAMENAVYEDIATKFFEHFIYIANAINANQSDAEGLWHEGDGFYYDRLRLPGGRAIPMRVVSIAGLIPLFAVATYDSQSMEALPGFKQRTQWFLKNRPDLVCNIANIEELGAGNRGLLAIVDREKLRRILQRMLDETRLLSPYGVRSVSRYHAEHPFEFQAGGETYGLHYEPGESTTSLFGGNSNWRGPIWFPLNYLLIESLQKFHYFLGDEFKVECPVGSGQEMTLWEVAAELSRRLISIFCKAEDGRRALYGQIDRFQNDPHWKDLVLFYEYFHGDRGTGLGASHQTGWTGLIAKLLQQHGEYALPGKPPRLDKGK